MTVDPNVEELKGENVFAMESVNRGEVVFHYLEDDCLKTKRTYGKRSRIFENYAAIHGLIWSAIGVGRVSEPCRDFKNGWLFVPLRGPNGVVYLRHDQYESIRKKDGRTYISCICGLMILSCQSDHGNQKKMEEARKIAAKLGYDREVGLAKAVAACTVGVKPDAPSIPLVEQEDSYGRKGYVREKKKRTVKKELFLQDILDACPMDREIESGQWDHGTVQSHFTGRAARCRKESEMKDSLSRFYHIIHGWEKEE